MFDVSGGVSMKSMLTSLVVLGVLCGLSSAAEPPAVAAIHEKIKELRAAEKVTLKEIHAWYESFIKRDKFTADVMRKEREVLKAQEDALLAVATNDVDKAAIRKQYESMRAFLREDIKLDGAAIKELRALEKAHETQVGNSYKAAILVLEEQAKAAAAAAAKPKKK